MGVKNLSGWKLGCIVILTDMVSVETTFKKFAFTKFKPLSLLQKKNGLPITQINANDMKCAELQKTVASTIKK